MRDRQRKGRKGGGDSRPPRDRKNQRGGRPGRGQQRDADPLGDRNDDPFRGRKAVDIDETDFSRLDVVEPLLNAVARSGYRSLTDFQEAAIPVLLEGEDMIARADDSSGRTTAVLIPLLHRLVAGTGSRVLVLVPTRRLGGLVAREARRLLSELDRKCTLIDPGSSINRQADSFEEDPAVIVATPGRLLDHIRRGNVDGDDIGVRVVFEVDRILDQNQKEDVEEILSSFDRADQTVMISNTITPRVMRFCRNNVTDAEELCSLADEPDLAGISHRFVVVPPRSGLKALLGLLEKEDPDRAVVFCRSKDSTIRVADRMFDLEGGVTELHAGIPQHRRMQLIERFKQGDFKILVSTDAAFQDLGVEDVSFVVNYDLPEHPEDYLFRATALSADDERDAAVVTLVGRRGDELLEKIEEVLEQDLAEETVDGLAGEEEEPPEKYAEQEREEKASPESSEAPEKAPVDLFSNKQDEKKATPNSHLFHGGWHRKSWRWKP